jgi:hypothetical protein
MFSLTVILKVSLTRSVIPRAAVVRIRGKASELFVYSICEGCFREVQTYRGIDITLGWSSKLNTLLGVHSWKPDRQRDPQQTEQCVYDIPCESGTSYIGETGRLLGVRLREHTHNIKEGLIENSKLAQNAYEEGRWIGWNEARILECENNGSYGKYKESSHMACLTNRISKPSLGISPIWITLISHEVSNSHGRSVWSDKFLTGCIRVYSRGFLSVGKNGFTIFSD